MGFGKAGSRHGALYQWIPRSVRQEASDLRAYIGRFYHRTSAWRGLVLLVALLFIGLGKRLAGFERWWQQRAYGGAVTYDTWISANTENTYVGVNVKLVSY